MFIVFFIYINLFIYLYHYHSLLLFIKSIKNILIKN